MYVPVASSEGGFGGGIASLSSLVTNSTSYFVFSPLIMTRRWSSLRIFLFRVTAAATVTKIAVEIRIYRQQPNPAHVSADLGQLIGSFDVAAEILAAAGAQGGGAEYINVPLPEMEPEKSWLVVKFTVPNDGIDYSGFVAAEVGRRWD